MEIRIETIPTSTSQYLRVTPMTGIMFPAVTNLRRTITARAEEVAALAVVVDCLHLNTVDFTTAAQVQVRLFLFADEKYFQLKEMMRDFSLRQQRIFWLLPRSR